LSIWVYYISDTQERGCSHQISINHKMSFGVHGCRIVGERSVRRIAMAFHGQFSALIRRVMRCDQVPDARTTSSLFTPTLKVNQVKIILQYTCTHSPLPDSRRVASRLITIFHWPQAVGSIETSTE